MALNEKICFEMRSQRLLERVSGIDWNAPNPSETVQNRIKWAFSVLINPNLSDFSYQILATDGIMHVVVPPTNKKGRSIYLSFSVLL